MNGEVKRQVVERTEAMVKERLNGESSGHDWWHIERVRRNALSIAGAEGGADIFVVELAALLHDISDWKFNGGDDSASSREAGVWLKGLGVDEETVECVRTAIKDVSFKGSGVKIVPSSAEGRIVQDADRLDAIGAIGIARAFAYGGKMGRLMYDPSIGPNIHRTFEEYKSNRGHTINHFYEKLLLLKDMMNTDAARRMAEERHDFMLEYLDRFKSEWKGEY